MQAAVALRGGRGAGATVTVDGGAATAGATGRPLYREHPLPGGTRPIGNLLKDPRIARGSTHAAPLLSPAERDAIERTRRDEEDRRRRRLATTRAAATAAAAQAAECVPPVSGRAHAELQTETYLEELSDRPPEAEAGTQTEAKLDRPPPPIFVPAPSGTDATTEILLGELFDFDFEVAPLLDVLVGRTLEQALAEMAQEDELSAIRARREEFEAVRSAELAEVQRIEAEVKRRFAEKTRRREQEAARLAREAEVRQKVAAAAFARSYLSALQRNVFATLHTTGHFYDPLRRQMETEVLPGLLAHASAALKGRQEVAVALVDDLLAAALAAAARKREAHLIEQARLREEARRAREEAERLAAEEAARVAAELAAAQEEGGDGGDE